MGLIDDILFEEDAKFLKFTENARKHLELQRQRQMWRDGKGIVHVLIPDVMNDAQGEPYIAGWMPACFYRWYKQGSIGREVPVTCFDCLVRDVGETVHQARVRP